MFYKDLWTISKSFLNSQLLNYNLFFQRNASFVNCNILLQNVQHKIFPNPPKVSNLKTEFHVSASQFPRTEYSQQRPSKKSEKRTRNFVPRISPFFSRPRSFLRCFIHKSGSARVWKRIEPEKEGFRGRSARFVFLFLPFFPFPTSFSNSPALRSAKAFAGQKSLRFRGARAQKEVFRGPARNVP